MPTATKKLVDLRIPVTVTEEDLINAIASGCISGPHGYAYWCEKITVDGRAHPIDRVVRSVLAGKTALVFESDDAENPKALTRAGLLNGFGMFAVQWDRFQSFDEKTGITEFEMDAPASDAILQFAVFGKQVYG